MAIKNPVRAEVVRDLIEVIGADYSKAVVKEHVSCPECGGEGVRVYDVKAGLRKKQAERALNQWGSDEPYAPEDPEETDRVEQCAVCKGAGYVEMGTFDFANIPARIRKHVTGFKAGPRGMLLPEMRNKDKAAGELIKAMAAGWVTQADFKRDAYGNDSTAEPEDITSKDGLIAAYEKIARTADPVTAMGALREISKLKGYLTEDDNAIDSQPLTMSNIQGFFNGILQDRGRALPPDNRPGASGSGNAEAGQADDSRPDDEGFIES